MAGPGGFDSEFLTQGFAENHLTPPTLNPNKTGLPYTNSSNHILQQTLAARDVALEVQTELQAALVEIQAFLERPEELGGIPVVVTDIQENDVLQYHSENWVNSQQTLLTDGGNF